jgi:hypothetical protein
LKEAQGAHTRARTTVDGQRAGIGAAGRGLAWARRGYVGKQPPPAPDRTSLSGRRLASRGSSQRVTLARNYSAILTQRKSHRRSRREAIDRACLTKGRVRSRIGCGRARPHRRLWTLEIRGAGSADCCQLACSFATPKNETKSMLEWVALCRVAEKCA